MEAAHRAPSIRRTTNFVKTKDISSDEAYEFLDSFKLASK